MIEKLKDDRFVKKILLVFLAIQPFLDCWLLYTDEVIGFFGFSPTTIIRTLIIAVLVLIVFFNKDNKKTRRFIYIYILVILLYTVIHNFLVFNLDNSGYKVFNYNLIVEMFYILRMMLPLCIIYITYCLKPKKEEIIQLFLIVGMCISIIIVASNLIVFSLASYGGGVIKGNVFDWFFSTKYTAGDLASKGWFNSANQISGLMYIVLPVCIYSLLEQVNKYRIAINILIVISMIMLGTRVATYGWLLLFIIMTIIYLFYSFVTKNQRFEKNRIYSILGILVVGLILMSHAPLVNTVTNYTDEDDDEMKRLRSENVSTKQLLKYIGMNGIYYKRIYKYEEHKKFWEYVVNEVPAKDRVGNRNSQTLIIKDVGKTYMTPDKQFFGLGYSRFISAYLYLEKDIIVHYYTIGIFGIILFLCPYVAIALISFIKFIKKKNLSMFNVTLLLVLVLPLGVSYFSGHIVDELIVSLYSGFVAGSLLYLSKGEIKNEKS